VTQIVSEFVKGKFTQTLTGQLNQELTIANFEATKNNDRPDFPSGVNNDSSGTNIPTRNNSVNNSLYSMNQPLNASGLPVPNTTADNVKVPTSVTGGPLNNTSTVSYSGINGLPTNPNRTPINVLQNLPPKPPTSNGPITETPTVDDVTVTNNVFQAINRDT